MPRNITVTFGDGTSHVYQNTPDDVTPDMVQARAEKEFSKVARNIDGGAKPQAGATGEWTPDRSIGGRLAMGAADAINYFTQGRKNIGGGALNAVAGVGASAMRIAPNFIGGDTKDESIQRRKDIQSAIAQTGADPESVGYQGAKLGTEIGMTMPIGGALAAGVGKVAPKFAAGAPNLLNALRTSGMTAGTAAPGAAGWLGSQALRAGTGATVGGISAGAVNPDDAGTGAIIGGVAPGVFKLAGMLGQGVYNAVRSNPSQAGKTLAKALGVDESQIPGIIAAANKAPESIVPGSKLTLSQALESQGANLPEVRTLEKVVAQSPGGKNLSMRYQDQSGARMNALVNQGAQRYQGAAAVEAENTGNQLAALLRTQAVDDNAAVRAAWQGADGLTGVHGRAVDEGAMLQLPIDRMKALVADRMGDGYTRGSEFTSKTIKEAERIGTFIVPGIKPIPKSAGQTQSLEQAVRAAGGIKPNEYLSGEGRALTNRQSGTTGLISKNGRDADKLAVDMHARGFTPDDDPATLMDMIRSGAARKAYANDHVEAAFQRMAEKAQGDMPIKAERVVQSVPFKSFQKLRSSVSSDHAALSAKEGNEVQAGVLFDMQKLMAGRADDAAMGNLLPGESMSPGLARDYQAARDLTRDTNQRYSGQMLSSILRKPVGQNYTLSGNEVTNKLWHGGAGLAGDVQTFKQTLSGNNKDSAIDQLRRYIMTDAADKTTASGQFAAALPSYVERRLPGLQEALNPDQLKALTGVTSDIRNATAASADFGMNGGSDTMRKISKAVNTGILDGDGARAIARALTFKTGLGDMARSKLAEMSVKNKAKILDSLLSDPKAAAAALANRDVVRSLDNQSLQQLRLAATRVAPVLAAD